MKPIKSVKVYDEMYFKDFKPWSGAVSTFDRILEEGKEDVMDDFLDEMYPDGISSTELNDLLWFEPEYVFEVCGISDYEDNEDNEDGEIESACHGKSKKGKKKPVKSGFEYTYDQYNSADKMSLKEYISKLADLVDDEDNENLTDDQYYFLKDLLYSLQHNAINSSSRKSVKSGKELEGKQKDDFIKKAMKKQGYSAKEADRMVSQSKHR